MFKLALALVAVGALAADTEAPVISLDMSMTYKMQSSSSYHNSKDPKPYLTARANAASSLPFATTTRSCSCWPTANPFFYPTESASSRCKADFASERVLNAAHRRGHLRAFSAYFQLTQKKYRTRRSCIPLRISRSAWNLLDIAGFFNFLLFLTFLAPMSSARKAGSGRKRKCDSLTSGDYARKLAALEWRPDMTTAEQNEFKKKQRSLKNRLSALKSREKKRAQMVELERQVAALQEQVRELQKQNNELRRGLIISPARTRCKSQSGNQARSDDSKNHNKRRCKTLGLPSLDELFPEQPKLSNVKKLELCAHNSESALGDAMDNFAFDIFESLDNSNSNMFALQVANQINDDVFGNFLA